MAPAGHAGDAFADSLLGGLWAGARVGGQYRLCRVGRTLLPPGGALQLVLEGAAAPVDGAWISGRSPFADDAEYEEAGRAELQRMQAELAAAGQPVGLDLAATAAGAWHRKVLLGWAPRLQELLASQGIE